MGCSGTGGGGSESSSNHVMPKPREVLFTVHCSSSLSCVDEYP